MEQSHSRDVLFSGFGDGNLHPTGGYHLSKSPVAVDQGGAGGLSHYRGLGLGDDLPLVDLVQVGGYADRAMGVVTHQVVGHQRVTHPLGDSWRRTCCLEDCLANES